jgi:transcriptional regulator with XRE-family HTH domain
MDIGRRIRDVREDLGMPAAELARRVGVAPNTVWRYESGEREPSMAMLEKIAHALRTEPAELLREPSPSAGAPSRASRETVSASMEKLRRVSARVEDAQRALLEAERLRETARPRVEEALARFEESCAKLEEARARFEESQASLRESRVEGAQASLREQVAHLQEVRLVMDEVYGTELELGWAYGKAMMEEGSPEGPRARRLRSASRKMVLFYEELVDLIRDAGVHVKRKDEGDVGAETGGPVRPEVLELTVH